MKKSLLLLILFFVCTLSGEEILLRFGAISDNHLNRKSPDSRERTRLAFEFFRRQKLTFFVDAGDVADTFQPDMFRLWRKMLLQTFPDASCRPDFLLIPAGHDKSGAASTQQGYEEFVKLTGSGAINPVKIINGYHFVSLAQYQNINILKRNLETAAAASKPGQPIFVITHVPPRATTGGSGGKASGDGQLRALLNKYPQVIVLSGHNHSRLLDARSIWQGEFTAVNLGSLAYCGDGGIANPAERPKSYDAAIVEVYAKKVVIRRFNVKYGKELFPEQRWTLPLPFSRENAPYSARAREKFPVANFAPGKKVRFQPGFTSPHRWGKLQLPPVDENSFAVSAFTVTVEKKEHDGKFSHYGIISFTRTELPDEKNGETLAFPAGYLEADSTYRITVTPVNFFQKAGRAISGEFSVGKLPRVESVNSWRPTWQPWKSKKILPIGADNFVSVKGDVRFLLPPQAAELAQKLKRKYVIVTLDIECIGKGKPASLRISNNRNQLISLPVGEYRQTAQKQRYSFIFQPQKRDRQHFILIRRGSPAKYRFSNIKTYVY